jgi:hypothetical protein
LGADDVKTLGRTVCLLRLYARGICKDRLTEQAYTESIGEIFPVFMALEAHSPLDPLKNNMINRLGASITALRPYYCEGKADIPEIDRVGTESQAYKNSRKKLIND